LIIIYQNENCTIELYNDIYLEFIHTKEEKKIKNNNGQGDEIVRNNILTLKLKSKKLNNEELIKWLSLKQLDYNEWVSIDTNMYIFISYKEKDKLDFTKLKFHSTKSFDNLFFEGKDLIIERLETYKNNKRYTDLGIPHSLGFLFYGEPGCGKTSCIKALAKYLNRHIISINLNHINDIEQLRTLFTSDYIADSKWFIPLKKRIYVFEEVDCFQEEDNPFLDRELKDKNNKIRKLENDIDKIANIANIDKIANMLKKDDEKSTFHHIKKKLTTGEVLEVLDGITEAEDRIIIFTTNNPDKIDKAFMRPGRIDVSINFKKLRRVDINNLYKLWFNKHINEKVLHKIKDYTFSQAEFGKLCFENTADTVLQKLIK